LTQGKFSHPVGDKVIDQRTGQMMTCVTCHDPMGSEHRYHLVMSAKKELCVQCHRSY
jgi:predicted CXXCH cytochrome family protein